MSTSLRTAPRAGACALACLLSLSPPPLPAQTALFADLDASLTHLSTDDIISAIASLTAWHERPRLRLIGIGTLAQDVNGASTLQAVGGATLSFRRTGPFTPSLGFEGSVLSPAHSTSRARAVVRGRAYAGGRRGGGWLEGGGGAADDGLGTRGVWSGGIGGWREAGPLTLIAATTATGIGEAGGTYLEAELAAQSVLGRLSLRAAAGNRWWTSAQGLGDEAWVEGAGSWQVERRLALTASVGVFPTDPLRGLGDGAWVQIGVRLGDLGPASPQAYALRREARRLAPIAVPVVRELSVSSTGTRRRLIVRVMTAGPVELAADFTDWEPTRLSRVAADRWAIDLDIPAGSYRLNLRVAGAEWGVPSGLPTVRDEFGGVVALLVLP